MEKDLATPRKEKEYNNRNNDQNNKKDRNGIFIRKRRLILGI